MMLILLYYLSQNPDFPESVKPIMGQLKNSEEMLKFLKDLSKFSEMFSVLRNPPKEHGSPPPPPPHKKAEEHEKKTPEKESEKNRPGDAACPSPEKEKPQSPTSGIADEFIEDCLERYFKRR